MGSAAGTPKDGELIYIRVPNVTKSGLCKTGYAKIVLNDESILLVYVKGQVYGMQDVCPHQGGPLEMGEIEEMPDKSQCIKCPWHSWRFSIATGICVSPGTHTNKRLKIYPVIIGKEEIRVGFPRLAPSCFQPPSP